jgi:hypothetical protein
VKSIVIKARNTTGLLGQTSLAEVNGVSDFMTRACSRHLQLKTELRNMVDLAEREPNRKHVDTMILAV